MENKIYKIVIALAIIVSSVYYVLPSINKVTNGRCVTTTVTDKGVKRVNDNDKYLIYTENEAGDIQVYEITDSVLKWRFNSSDLYAEVEVGKTYKMNVCGNRIQILSWYPNIYSITEITDEIDSEQESISSEK